MSPPVLLVLKEKLAPYLDQREFPHVQEHMTDRAAWDSTRHEVTDSKQHRPVIQSAPPAVLRTPGGESAEPALPKAPTLLIMIILVV